MPRGSAGMGTWSLHVATSICLVRVRVRGTVRRGGGTLLSPKRGEGATCLPLVWQVREISQCWRHRDGRAPPEGTLGNEHRITKHTAKRKETEISTNGKKNETIDADCSLRS